jgi:endonuclease G
MSRRSRVAVTLSALAPLAIAGIGKIPGVSPSPQPPNLSAIDAPLPGAPPGPPVTPPPAAPADQPACLTKFAGAAGLPVHGSADSASAQTVICRQGYALSFNATTHNPDWVVERLTPAQLEVKFARDDAFAPDPALGSLTPTLDDYKSGDVDNKHYQRGHQAPNQDFASSKQMGAESFYMSNMSPQVGAFNGGIWRVLEGQVRMWVTCTEHSDLFVITGPIYRRHDREIGADRVWVPKAYYKIVYDAVHSRAVGFILDNTKADHPGGDFSSFVQPIAEIERETGLNFFAKLPKRGQDMLEKDRAAPWGHISQCDDPAGAG